TLSSHCANALCAPDGSSDQTVARLAGNYADMLGLEAPQVLAAVDAAQRTAEEEEHGVLRVRRREAEALESEVGKPADAASVLARGVADMRGAMEGSSAGQVMTMGLETVYQG